MAAIYTTNGTGRVAAIVNSLLALLESHAAEVLTLFNFELLQNKASEVRGVICNIL
jgi:hypothetical protein